MLSSSPDVTWLAEAVRWDDFIVSSLVYDKCARFQSCCWSAADRASVPWPSERTDSNKGGDIVEKSQCVNLDSSFLGEVGSNCKGGLCTSGSQSNCSSKLCWDWDRTGRLFIWRFLLPFSQTDRLLLFGFEIVFPMWVKTEVTVKHKPLPRPCDCHLCCLGLLLSSVALCLLLLFAGSKSKHFIKLSMLSEFKQERNPQTMPTCPFSPPSKHQTSRAGFLCTKSGACKRFVPCCRERLACSSCSALKNTSQAH